MRDQVPKSSNLHQREGFTEFVIFFLSSNCAPPFFSKHFVKNHTSNIAWRVCTLRPTYCPEKDPGWRIPFLKLFFLGGGYTYDFLSSENGK
jgi:hypothetical protein